MLREKLKKGGDNKTTEFKAKVILKGIKGQCTANETVPEITGGASIRATSGSCNDVV